jgi:hypothetical protein
MDAGDLRREVAGIGGGLLQREAFGVALRGLLELGTVKQRRAPIRSPAAMFPREIRRIERRCVRCESRQRRRGAQPCRR